MLLHQWRQVNYKKIKLLKKDKTFPNGHRHLRFVLHFEQSLNVFLNTHDKQIAFYFSLSRQL